MTNLRKAAEMALESLCWATEFMNEKEKENAEKSKDALCQALAQPEQGNSSTNYPNTESNTSLNKIVEKAIQQEREACAKLVEADGLARGNEGLVLIKAAGRIRTRSEK